MPFGVAPKKRSPFDVFQQDSDWRVPMALPPGSDFSSMLTKAFNPERAEVEMLARTAIGEARGEGDEGMRAVMHTIMNRVAQTPGGTVTDIVMAPSQFSAWDMNNPNREFMESIKLEENESLIDMAEKVISRQDKDPTGGATHYYAPKHVEEAPGWAGKMEKTATIGGHEFYKEPKRRKRNAKAV